jgi:hypothetical protein
MRLPVVQTENLKTRKRLQASLEHLRAEERRLCDDCLSMQPEDLSVLRLVMA